MVTNWVTPNIDEIKLWFQFLEPTLGLSCSLTSTYICKSVLDFALALLYVCLSVL